MSYFKRFTNFCGGFAAFAAMLHLVGEYMMFKAPEAEGMTDKLREFLSVERADNFRGYAIMVAFFVLSVALGRIFERLPYITFAVSLLPLYQVIELYSSGKLVKFPSLYLLFAIIHTTGNLVYALILDREDGKRRAFWCVNLLGALIAMGGVWLWNRANELSVYEDPLAVEELSKFESKVALAAGESFQGIVLRLAIIFAISVIISIVLRDIYFIDAIIAIVPVGYAVNEVLLFDKLFVFEELCIILCALYFASRVALVVFEPMRSPRVDKKAPSSVDSKDAEMV